MKKHRSVILVGCLVILQFLTLIKVLEINQELKSTKEQLISTNAQVHMKINSLYSNIDSSLKQQASIIDSFDYSVGEINTVDYTIPITFKIIPKEITTAALVNLFQSDNKYSMTRNGSHYHTTFSISIFDRLNPTITIEDQGIEKIESLSIFEVMKHRVLPQLNYTFSQKPTYVLSSKDDMTWKREGNIGLHINPVEGNTIESARVLVEIDNVIVTSIALQVNEQRNPIHESHTLIPGQSLSFRIEAVDSIGLRYTATLEQIKCGENGEFIYDENQMRNSWNWIISDASGTILGSTEESYD